MPVNSLDYYLHHYYYEHMNNQHHIFIYGSFCILNFIFCSCREKRFVFKQSEEGWNYGKTLKNDVDSVSLLHNKSYFTVGMHLIRMH